MNNLEYAKQQIDRFYLDIKEYGRQNPSYHFIQSYSQTLFKVISDLEKENVVLDIKLSSLRMEADILNEDIPGELYDDYKKGNKRYRENWQTQKRKIDNVTSELYDHLSQLLDLS
jgi:hypothetical protein